VKIDLTNQSDMADEATSEGGFDVETCLKAIMTKLDYTTDVSERALKMAQDIQHKMSEPEQNNGCTPGDNTEDGTQSGEGIKTNEGGRTKPKGSEPPEVFNLEGGSKGKTSDIDSVMASKVEVLERTIKGIRRTDDMVDVRTLSLFPQARIPLQFKMPELEKFDGMGCPKTHLKMYVRAMHPRGATDELLAQMFHETLATSALKWFLALDENRTRTWEDICNEFSEHYKYNTEVDVTRRDLETTKQGANETFSAFITRWRQKASKMADRPNEEDQIQLVVKNLLPVYHKHLFAHYFPNFKALIGAGTQVEDAIADGLIKTEEVQSSRRPNFAGKNNAEVNAIAQPIQLISLNDTNPPRQFTELHMPLEKVLEKLKSRGLLKPLDPRPPPNPLPKNYNESEYCKFHQTKGHSTNRCYRLRHEIQDLLDKQIISPPTPPNRPNVTQNPLPSHNSPNSINAIEADPSRPCLPIRQYTPLPMSLTQAFYQCHDKGLIIPHLPKSRPQKPHQYCQYHGIPGHDTEDCAMMRKVVQDLIDQKTLQLPKKSIQQQLKERYEAGDPRVGLLGEPSGKFDYYVLYPDPLPSEPIIPTGWDDMPEEVQMEDIDMIEWDDLMGDTNEIDDIWASDEEIDHMTRGGRHFKPPHLESDNPLGELDKRFDVQEEEDEVLRQLKKTNANITIWGLLMASHKHR